MKLLSIALLHVAGHVQEEEELTVADPGQPRPEPTGIAPLGFRLDRRLVHLPFLAEGWVGEDDIYPFLLTYFSYRKSRYYL